MSDKKTDTQTDQRPTGGAEVIPLRPKKTTSGSSGQGASNGGQRASNGGPSLSGHGAAAASAKACPMCGKRAEARYTPFCSKRCADLDLGKWLGGDYRVPTDEMPEEGDWESAREAARRDPSDGDL